MPRQAKIERKTNETDIRVDLNLDGSGKSVIKTGLGFLDHMLNALARHSLMDLKVQAKGDLHVDDHHTVEDVGICIGQALNKALGSKTGIQRFGWAVCPMDEALTRVSMDLSGRPHFVWEFPMNLLSIGPFQTETIPEFFQGLAIGCGMTLHMDLIRGRNLHHALESMFKSFAKALQQATAVQPRDPSVPSTKGVIA
ncbi:imidazoleglycerol-phosphate dehydratase HisB [bacterium]|nr:imidazoleglycerol-phosphate dehydratase HisB [bacterium]